MTEWNIQSRGHGCEACGKPFTDKEPYHTILFEEKAELRRSDVCAGCWQGKFSGVNIRENFISCWQGVYHIPAPPAETIKKETAETLLRKLIELNDPQYIPAGYILAVMLERKRLLKVKEQLVRDGQRVFVYEDPRSGDVFTIIDPNLQLDQLEQVQRDVGTLLERGLNPPAPEAAAAEGHIAPAEDAANAAPDAPAAAEAPAETKAE